jgi:hypothetical protein
LKGPWVDFKEHLAFTNEIAFLVILFNEVPSNFRLDLNVHVAIEVPNPIAKHWNILLDDFCDVDLRGRHRRRRLLFLATHSGQ